MLGPSWVNETNTIRSLIFQYRRLTKIYNGNNNNTMYIFIADTRSIYITKKNVKTYISTVIIIIIMIIIIIIIMISQNRNSSNNYNTDLPHCRTGERIVVMHAIIIEFEI